MKDVYGNEIIAEDTKKCRDCGEVKSIEEFSINRKFYRPDHPEKHRVLRRPSCDTCRSKKKKIKSSDRKYWTKPDILDCPVCGDRVDGSYARLDHDHETGVIRGWLCDNCNTAIGKLKESPEVMQRAIDWVKNKHKSTLEGLL